MKINGSLVFDASSASEIQNLRLQKVSSLPAATAADKGRLIYNTTDDVIYVNTGTAWVSVATGGSSAAIQSEVDSIEASLGAGVASDGTFVAGAFSSPITAATSFTDAINQLAAYANSNNQLSELDDVQLTGLADNQIIKYNSGASRWENHTLVLADVSDVTVPAAQLNLLNGLTASASELNVLDGITGTTTADLSSIAGYAPKGVSADEFGYLDGVTGPIQAQLDGKQPLDGTLTALAAFNTDGLVVQTAADTFAGRSLVAPSAGITITNPDGVAGNPTFALANDLAALEGLTGNGYIVRTGDGTATTRTIDGNAGRIVVTNGDGVSSNTNIDLATVTQGSTGNLVKITLDSYGRVVANTPVVASDITGLVDASYVSVTGDTMTGSLVMSGTGTHVVLPNPPTAANHAANKAYVDTVAEGLRTKPAVEVILRDSADLNTIFGSPSPVAGTDFIYDNGTGGVGATITAAVNGAWGSVDGYTITSTTLGMNGVLVAFPNNTPNAVYNGRYNLTQLGSSTTPWVLTRCALCDEGHEIPGSYTFVKNGTQYAGSGWVQVRGTDVDSENDLDVGTDQIWLNQFSGASSYTAGAGLQLSGTEFSINMGAGIAELPGDQVGIDLFSPTSGGIILTTDGTTRSTDAGAKLHLLLPTGSGLTQDATGLRISAAGVTNAMLLNSTITINGDSGGTDAVALGETLSFFGSASQGITTSRSADNTITVSALDASASQKGVASFNATEFSVSAGNVALGTVPVAKLSADSINFVGTDSSSDAVSLGGNLTFASAVSGLFNISVASDTVTLGIRQASTTATGVASFNPSFFSVSSGVVSLNATLDDLVNVYGADTALLGSLLTRTSGGWEPITRGGLMGTVTLSQLQDVVAASPAHGDVLVRNLVNWVNTKIYHLHNQATPSTTWTVTHNLNQKYCNVTVVDASDEVVIPQSITFVNDNQLTVTFNTAVAGKVVVMGNRFFT